MRNQLIPDQPFSFDQFVFQPGTHRNKAVIWVKFPYNIELQVHLRRFVHAHWSASQKCWYVVDCVNYRKLFHLPEKAIGKRALMKIHSVNQPAFEQYRDMLYLKGYSPNTIRTYCLEFAQLLYVLKTVPAESLTKEQLKSYCLYCIKKCKLSENQMHSRFNALKFYYEQVLHREKLFFDIPRPKKPHILPKVLNKKEIKKTIAVTTNLKHRLIIKMGYGMGLRVSEIVNLKIKDIDSTDMKVLIAQSKGKKDRYVNLPVSLLEELRLYYKQYCPKEYLFEGQFGGAYSVRSAQNVFKNAMKKAGIKKQVGIHSLRHSYATHLLENGTDISLIQKLLGHNSIKTTLIYTHVEQKNITSIQSPLDRI